MRSPTEAMKREVVVDDGVEQRVEQLVGPAREEARIALAQAGADRIEGVAREPLDGHDNGVADEEAHLVAHRVAVDEGDGVRDDEVVVGVGLDLRALVRVDGVLDGERVVAELARDGLDEAPLEAAEVEPDDLLAPK